jgi:hypothetical protein
VSELASAITGFVSGILGSVATYRVLMRPRLVAPDGTDSLSIAVAELERQLDALEFNPEAEGVTADMRGLYSRARAAGVDASNAMPHRKYVLPALARGRDALVRLDAMRNNRPVPLENLSRAELRAVGASATLAATDERFAWKGKRKPTEFLLDRPESGRPTLVRVSATGGGYVHVTVAAVERTAERIRDHTHAYVGGNGLTYAMIPAAATHLRVEPTDSTTWAISALPHDLLPTTDSAMHGKGPKAFHHRRGSVPVVLQAQGGGGNVMFYADCDCREHCEDESMHREGLSGLGTATKEYRESGKLPEKAGVIIVDIEGTWSLDVVDV